MRKRITVAFIAILLMLPCAFGMTACKEGDDNTETDEHSHVFTEYIYNNDATCVTDGTETAKCEKCDETDTRTKANTATGVHTFSNYIYNNDATCTADGTETSKCAHCDETDTRAKIGSAGHSYTDYVCTVCGEAEPDAPVTEGLEYTEIKESGEVVAYAVAKGSAHNDAYDKKYINIPAIHKGKPVTAISAQAFYYCVSIIRVSIPNSVTSIGDMAFFGCGRMTGVTIPSSVKSIGNSAFEDCTRLPNITIPEGVEKIGDRAFDNCAEITSVVIPSTVTSMGDGVFSHCHDLESLTVQRGSAEYPRYIDKNNCIIDTYPKAVIAGCKNSVIPDDGSVTYIGKSAFRGCIDLADVTIPNGVQGIWESAFTGCIGLSSVNIPSSIKRIEESAFRGCDILSSISFRGDIANWCAIFGLKNLMPYGASGKTLSIGGAEIKDSLVIPTSVPVIRDYAFYKCGKVSGVDLNSDLQQIGEEAFFGCAVTSINFRGDIANWCAINGLSNLMPYGASDKTLSIGGAEIKGSLVIPTCVTVIRDYAFYDRGNITSIEIPSGVNSIGNNAFGACNNITNAVIPANAVSSIPKTKLQTVKINGGNEIGEKAFENSSELTSIEIPSSVTKIGKEAFKNCGKLTSATFANTSGWKAKFSDEDIRNLSFSDASTAATYLKSTYCGAEWNRS